MLSASASNGYSQTAGVSSTKKSNTNISGKSSPDKQNLLKASASSNMHGSSASNKQAAISSRTAGALQNSGAKAATGGKMAAGGTSATSNKY